MSCHFVELVGDENDPPPSHRMMGRRPGLGRDACGKTNFLLSLAVSNDQTFSARDVLQDTDRDRHLLLLLPPPRYSSGGRGAIVIVKPCQIVGRGPEFQPVALSERERERERETSSHSPLFLLSILPTYLHMVDIFRLTARANSEALFEKGRRR